MTDLNIVYLFKLYKEGKITKEDLKEMLGKYYYIFARVLGDKDAEEENLTERGFKI